VQKALFLFPLSATEERQNKKISEDVDDTAGENNNPEALGRRKIGQHENGNPAAMITSE